MRARRVIRGVAIVTLAIVGLVGVALAAAETGWFKGWLRRYIVREANQYLNAQLSIGSLGGNLFSGVELGEIELSAEDSPLITIKNVRLEYNPLEFVTKGLFITRLRINVPVVYLRRTDAGWSIAHIVKAQRAEANRTGPERPIRISDIDITAGALSIEGHLGPDAVHVPQRFEQINARFSFSYEPVRYTVDIGQITLRGFEPALELNGLSGSVAVRDDALYLDKVTMRTAESSLAVDGSIQRYLSEPRFNFDVTSEKISLPEIARIAPALAGVPLQPAIHMKLDGPNNQLGIVMSVRSSAGDVAGQLVGDFKSPTRSVSGDVDLSHVDLRPMLANRTDPTDITAHVHGEMHGPGFGHFEQLEGLFQTTASHVTALGYAADNVKGTVGLKARVLTVNVSGAGYGARVTAAGRLGLPAEAKPLTYAFRGRAQGVDLRRLPPRLKVASADTNLNADYNVTGSGSDRVQLDAKLFESTVAGVRVAPGSTAKFSMDGKRIAYATDANVEHADLQRIGRAFAVQALQPDRYQTNLNGHLVLNGEGTTLETLKIAANGSLVDSTVQAGRISNLAFDGTIVRDTVHTTARGSFTELDPERLFGKPAMAGNVAGDLDVDVTVANMETGVTLESVTGSGCMSLAASAIGGFTIDRATVEGDYRDAVASIRSFDLVGPDITAHANGTLALNESSSSNLVVHAESSSVGELAKLASEPLTGIGKVDATLTGNRRDLRMVGSFIGNDLTYNANRALVLTGDFSTAVPDLNWTDARVTADLHGTFVTLAGQNLNDLTAKAEYDRGQLTFDTTGTQPARAVRATGAVVIDAKAEHADVNRLSIQSKNIEWKTPAGSTATVQWESDAISIEHLQLVNGPQAIDANGTFGKPGATLSLSLRNVDLASADAFLPRPLELSGTLNASAEVGGTKTAPTGTGEFSVTQGAVRQVHYDSFTGKVTYARKGLTVDTRLQQTGNNWIEAKGYVPGTAFGIGRTAPRVRDHHEPVSRDDEFDLHIQSSPIALGLLEGYPLGVSKLTGTAEVNVDVSGAADDPHPTGVVSIQNAAFTVKATGASYAHLNGRIDLEPDRVHITDIEILDADQRALSITGDLALHEQQIGNVNIDVNTRDFKIIDNRYGNLRVDSDLRITGELTAPRIEGDVYVSTGQVNLDPIFEDVGDSAFTPVEGEPLPANEAPSKPAPKGFRAIELNVHARVPDDLVLKSRDVRTSDSPIGLGAMNVTVGGDMRVVKAAGEDKVRVVGTVNTVRGTYNFQGRTFTILRDGTIRFEGGDEVNPDLNVIAQRNIQGVEANVGLYGTMKMPEVVLTSNPPLEPADILSLIIFNQSLSQLGTGQQAALTQRAEQLAAGTLAGTLATSLGNALNLSEFSIQTQSDSGALGAQVTAGQQVSENLYVKVEQGFGEATSTSFILEYEIAKWVRLRTNFLQQSGAQPALFQRPQGSGVDLLFSFRH